MTLRFGKWPKYLGNGLDAWGTAQVFEKRLNDLGNGLRICQKASICIKWGIYLGIGLSVWETTKIFGKWRRSVGNGSNMWGIDLIIWQTS